MGYDIKKSIKINNFSEIFEKYDSIICDIWGVIHNGQELFRSSIDCLYELKNNDYPVVLVSNSPRPGY